MTGEFRRMTGEYRRPSRTEIERTALPSILDRLTDLAPSTPADRMPSREASVREYRASVQRDVEELLNTRRTIVYVDEQQQPEVHASVHQYGLPDVTQYVLRTSEGRKAIVDALRDTLERFEPRLENPVVQLVTEEAESGMPVVRFTVEALLRMSPSAERVVFDTTLEVASGAYEVREQSHGPAAGPPPSPTR